MSTTEPGQASVGPPLPRSYLGVPILFRRHRRWRYQRPEHRRRGRFRRGRFPPALTLRGERPALRFITRRLLHRTSGAARRILGVCSSRSKSNPNSEKPAAVVLMGRRRSGSSTGTPAAAELSAILLGRGLGGEARRLPRLRRHSRVEDARSRGGVRDCRGTTITPHAQ